MHPLFWGNKYHLYLTLFGSEKGGDLNERKKIALFPRHFFFKKCLINLSKSQFRD